MNELHIILAVLWGAGCFALGGTEIKKFGRGFKWIRRFVMPAGLGLLALLYAPYWAVIGYTATLIAFLHLGYGDRCSWLKRVFIFTGYGAASLWFGFTWWTLITPVVLTLTFMASRWKPLAKDFPWKVWEIFGGLLISVCYVVSISKKW